MDYIDYMEQSSKQLPAEVSEVHFARGIFSETLSMLFSFMHA